MKVDKTPPPPPGSSVSASPAPSNKAVRCAAVQYSLLTSLGKVASKGVADPSPDQQTFDALQLISDLSKLSLAVASGQTGLYAQILNQINTVDVPAIQAEGDPESILYGLGWTTTPVSGVAVDIANFNQAGGAAQFLQDWEGTNPQSPNTNALQTAVFTNWYSNLQTFRMGNLPANEQSAAMMNLYLVNLSGLLDSGKLANSVVDAQFFGFTDQDGRGFGKNFSQIISAYFWMQDVGSSSTATPAQWQKFTTDMQSFASLLPTAAQVGSGCPNYTKYVLSGNNGFQNVINTYFSPSSSSMTWPWPQATPAFYISQVFGRLYGAWQTQ